MSLTKKWSGTDLAGDLTDDVPVSDGELQLYEAGFHSCFIGSEPCPGFVSVRPGTTDKDPKTLICSQCPSGPISPSEAASCQKWLAFVPIVLPANAGLRPN